MDPDPEALAWGREVFEGAGFVTRGAGDLDEARTAIDARPAAVVVAESLSREVLALVRAAESPQPSAVVRGPPTEEGVAEAYECGADDFVSSDAPRIELIGRVWGLLRNRGYLEVILQKQRDAAAMLELTQALASSLDFSQILHTVVRRIADVVNVDRASIVLAPDDEGQTPAVGFVVATSDDREIANLQLDLLKYPEIVEVLRSLEPLTIADTATHPVLDGVRESVPDHAVGALSLLPIVWRDEAMGVLFLRSARKGALTDREMDFCRIVANATAIALRNARVMQSLRDQTQKVNYARFEAERRTRALERYANLFTSAADGLAAVDPDGKMLFANPRAYAVAGVTEQGARGKNLRALVHPGDHRRLLEIWRRIREGDFPGGVDLRMQRPDGTIRIVSCAFSSLLESEGAILVSFRDVTLDRAMAAELVETKDFLESLIDASVDAIIASDLHGEVLIFNKGAERIYGYRQDEVVGKMNVRDLYPSEGAADVMRMLRSAQHGGEGRLVGIPFDALDGEGHLVPIRLSAAMIFDAEGEPMATVGIFTDLREKLRVEERLAQAQQKLAVTEKQALIAELAGTAAHELNQPLTSVIGYGELLTRKLTTDTPTHHAAEVIVREAERMADIVRKIGKITRYETKSYVGAQKIIDLDKSSADDTDGGLA